MMLFVTLTPQPGYERTLCGEEGCFLSNTGDATPTSANAATASYVYTFHPILPGSVNVTVALSAAADTPYFVLEEYYITSSPAPAPVLVSSIMADSLGSIAAVFDVPTNKPGQEPGEAEFNCSTIFTDDVVAKLSNDGSDLCSWKDDYTLTTFAGNNPTVAPQT
jgi:hypothetical protein